MIFSKKYHSEFAVGYPLRARFSLAVLFCVFSLFAGKLQAKTIKVSSDKAGELQAIINKASKGDVIQFTDKYYNLRKAVIYVTKPLTFVGKNAVGFNAYHKGASGVQTTLANAFTFILQTDDVQFKNLKIIQWKPQKEDFSVLLDGRTQDYKDNFRNPGVQDGKTFKGINLSNVVLKGGYYGCFAGNGIGATFEHVSFIDYRRIGYINDRRARNAIMPTVVFDFCRFKPLAPESASAGFDNRGISFDAGNTEYPIVWGGNKSAVKNTLFINTGIAISRCHSLNITNNLFKDGTGYVDLVHIEEWSHNIVVNGNTFDCKPADLKYRSRVMQFDRELQTVGYIYINNNTIKGDINFFISAYCPNNVFINDNDFTKANGTNVTIGFDFYEFRAVEPIEEKSEFVSFNVNISNNPGLEAVSPANLPSVRMRVPKNGGNINVKGVSRSKQSMKKGYYPQPLIQDGIYQIVNSASGRKLATNNVNSGMITTSSNANDAASKWEVKFNAPYYYHIKNVKNGRFMEAHKGYTEAEIFQKLPQEERPFLFKSNNYTPRWSLVGAGKASLFEIFVGGNEKQAALISSSNNSIKLAFGKKGNADGTRSPVKFSDNAKWKFVKVSNRRTALDAEAKEDVFVLGSNPVSDILSIRYESESDAVVDVMFYDIHGRVIKEDKLFSHANTSFDISDLNKGIYLVKTSNGHAERLMIK